MAKKEKTNPVETRLRQILTEVLLDMPVELKAAERAEVVDICMEDYGDNLLLNAEGFLALALRTFEEEEEGLDDEEGED